LYRPDGRRLILEVEEVMLNEFCEPICYADDYTGHVVTVGRLVLTDLDPAKVRKAWTGSLMNCDEVV